MPLPSEAVVTDVALVSSLGVARSMRLLRDEACFPRSVVRIGSPPYSQQYRLSPTPAQASEQWPSSFMFEPSSSRNLPGH